jgi:hypothetical protein
MIRGKIAIVLMIVPLLVAIAIGYWESAPRNGYRNISRVAMLRVQLKNGAPDELAHKLIDAVREQCDGKDNLKIESDAQADAADALIESTITQDAGIVELELRLIDAATRKVLWRQVYQTSQTQSAELMHNAAQALFRTLRG